MEANALNNSSDKLGFACFKVNIEEHTCGIRVFKRTSVAVKPRGKYHTAAACRDAVRRIAHTIKGVNGCFV